MRSTRRRALLLTPVSLLLGGGMCAPELAPIEPVKIGVLNPLTGQLGSLGPQWEDAARLAAEQVDAAGGLFDGRPLDLLFFDTETNPNAAKSAARQAIEAGAVAIVGPASSGESGETLNVIAGYEVPQVSCCATSPSLTQTDDWFFRTAPNDLLQAKALAYLAAQGRDTEVQISPCQEAAVVHRDDTYGTGLADVFVTEFGARTIAGTSATGDVVAQVPYPANATDVRAMVTSTTTAVMDAFEASHDTSVDDVCVLLVSFAPDGAALVQQLRAAFSTWAETHQPSLRIEWLATDGLYDNAFALEARGSAAGVVGTAPTHAENNAYRKFQNAYHARFGVDPGNLTSNMYDAVMLLALAITQTRSTEGSHIRDALFDVSSTGRRFDGAFFGEMAEALLSGEDIDYVGPSGELDFDAAGDVVGDYTLWEPLPSAGGSYEIQERDFLPATEFAE